MKTKIETFYKDTEGIDQYRLGKKNVRGGMITLFRYLKGEGQDLFSVFPEKRSWNNGLKFQDRQILNDDKEKERLPKSRSSLTMESITQRAGRLPSIECVKQS